jgi:4-amino-4-deoxy-L-arabinose transferase-like glycosyltransferase
LAIAAVLAGFLMATLIWQQRPRAIEPTGSIIATTEHAEIYGLLARGFLRGQLDLAIAPDPALTAAANPYDPTLRPKVWYPHDASLFRGKFYAYFGPAPAILAYAPWRALTGTDLPTSWAVLGFATLAFLGSVTLFWAVTIESYPNASAGLRAAAIIGLGSTSLILPLVRRPAVYEAAIAAGAAAMLWGLYLAWRGRGNPGQIRWGAGCGALLGLAIASRPTFGLAALPAWMILSGSGQSANFSLRWTRGVTGAAISGGAIVALLLAYNHARFGSPLEFGQKYQLAALNENTVQHFGLRFVPTQAWLYLFSPLNWSGFFPFAEVAALASKPAGFGSHELSFGILTNLPFLVLAAWTFAQTIGPRTRNPIAAPLLVGFTAALGMMLLYYYSAVRYQTEFALWLGLAAAFGALEFGRSRCQQALVWALAIAAAVVVALVCVRAYEPEPHRSPSLLDPLARGLNWPAKAWRKTQGLAPGPVIIDLDLNQPAPAQEKVLVRVEGPAGESESLLIGSSPAGGSRLIVRREGSARGEAHVDLSAIPMGQTAALTVNLSSLYPLNETEMDGPMDAAAFRSLKNWIRLDWADQNLLTLAVPPLSWRPERILAQPAELATSGWPAHPGVTAVRRGPPQPVLPAIEPWGGVRIIWDRDHTPTGQFLPLGSTGHPGQANFLSVRTGPGNTLTFAYDHWGKPLVVSPPIVVEADNQPTITFWMPSLVSPELPTPLVVQVNGRPVWTVRVPFFPATPAERFVLRNPIGGSSCAPLFPQARVTAGGLPLPDHP